METFNSNQVGYLQSPKNAAETLSLILNQISYGACKQEDFLFTLQNIAIAQGVANVAEKAGFCRESLYKILSPLGNPRLDILLKIIDALGLEFQVRVAHKTKFLQISPITQPNSIAHIFPSLIEQWHPIKNGKLTPQNTLATSNRKIWWLCSKDPSHVWEAAVCSRVKNIKSDFLKSPTYTEKSFTTITQKCPYCVAHNNNTKARKINSKDNNQ